MAGRRRRPPSEQERERDRRLGAAAERAAAAARSLERLDEPVVQPAPLAAGDPVVAAELGVRGTIAEIAGDEATCSGRGGAPDPGAGHPAQPDPDAAGDTGPPTTARDRAGHGRRTTCPTRSTCAGGGRTRRARQSGSSSTRPHLAGRHEVRVIHGRGTGAVRKAVRDELAKHPLVDEQLSDSADGATVVRLSGA